MAKQSEYRNVCWYARTGRWLVKIHMRGHFTGRETIYIGYYENEHYAARVADLAEMAVRGHVLQANLPEEPIEAAERTELITRFYQQSAITQERFTQLLS